MELGVDRISEWIGSEQAGKGRTARQAEETGQHPGAGYRPLLLDPRRGSKLVSLLPAFQPGPRPAFTAILSRG